MSKLKTFAVAPEKDSVRTAFLKGQRLSEAYLSLERAAPGFPEYILKQNGVRVALLRGKEVVCGGEHFAVIPFLPTSWEEDAYYVPSNANVPYWDGEQRLESLSDLLYSLSCGLPIPQALDDAVDLQDEGDFFRHPQEGAPAHTPQPEDYPQPEEQPQEYLWTIWYEGRGGVQRADITCTRELAGKVWDLLAGEMSRMLSARP